MTYEEKIETMLKYLQLKIHEKDWHGVADCAMDLRDIEAEKKGRNSFEIQVKHYGQLKANMPGVGPYTYIKNEDGTYNVVRIKQEDSMPMDKK